MPHAVGKGYVAHPRPQPIPNLEQYTVLLTLGPQLRASATENSSDN